MASLADDQRWCLDCGGELRHIRQREGKPPAIHTYLVCQMPRCGWKKWLMTYYEETGHIQEAVSR